MSCNGCRVLRRGCNDQCILRPCLEWIRNPEAQGNAILFVSKFFGRSDLLSSISNVPQNKRPALFKSLLFEACGRTVNPVNGAVGLLSAGDWNICQEAVETVLSGGVPRPVSVGASKYNPVMHGSKSNGRESYGLMGKTISFGSGLISPEFGIKETKLLNLFA
ncbi:hypothetical protein ACJIZ3_025070 [Penstemon smallii]|uniref:LOB domain-containing protein n=1 Tax=Penstemon smallii TaxID=265156 RepID=A0ABD3TTK4_9LAMI